MEVDSSYSYCACRGHVGPCVQCPSQWGKVERPRTGLQPPFGNSKKEWAIWLCREVGRVYTLTQLFS